MKYVFDTSFISAFFNTDDIHHQAAIDNFAAIIPKDKIIIPSTVIAELSAFHQNFLLRDLMVESARSMGDIGYFDKPDLNKFILFIKSISFSLSAIDSTILFIALACKATLLTFDKKLFKVYKQLS